MKIFVAGIVLACAGTGVAQMAMTPPHEQAQAAPAPAPAETEPTYQHITSLPFDASTYNMNSADYKSVDSGDDPAKLWDASDSSTARSAEGWDGTSPSIPGTVTKVKTGASGTSGASGSKAKAGSTGSTAKAPGKAPAAAKPRTGLPAKPKAPASIRIAQGTKGTLATPQTLSLGASVKPRKIPVY